MIINNKEYIIKDKDYTENYNNNILQIKLTGINNVTDMSCMFFKCSSLKLNTNNFTNIS